MHEPPLLAGPQFDADPYPALAWLRANSPVRKIEVGVGSSAWFVTRYQDAEAALADPRLAKSPFLATEQWRKAEIGLPMDHRQSLVHHMLNADPPDHARLRRLVSGAFSTRRMAELRSRVQEVTDSLLDRIAAQGSADLIPDLAYPLPITIICELLGVPEDRLAEFHKLADVINTTAYLELDEVRQATDGLDAFITSLVAAKRVSPGPDMLSELVSKQDSGLVNADELAATAFLLLVAGHETSVAYLGNAVLILLQRPDLARSARDDDTARARILEEVLRFDPPVTNATWRFPTEPVTIGDQLIQPGEPVLISLSSANRDFAVFPDADTFDPDRDTRGHLAFGRGPHFCIGSALARLEADIAIGTLLRRFPDLALAEPAESLTWWPSPFLRGLFRLPVTF